MLVELIILLSVLLGSLLYLVNKRPPNYAPVPKLSFPIVGHFPYFAKYEKAGLHRMFMDWGKQCGSSIFGVDFGNYNAVILNDYKLIKEAWNMPELSGRVVSRAMAVRGGDEGFSRGLIWSDGKHWSEQRRFALRNLKEFGFGKQSMENVISIEAEELVLRLKTRNGKPVSTLTLFNPAVVNSLWQICAGERFPHEDPQLAEIVEAVIQNVQDTKVMGTVVFMQWFCSLAPKLSGWKSYLDAFHLFNHFMTQFVVKRMEEHELGSRRDFTDLYLNEMKTETDQNSSFFGDEGRKQLINSLGDIFAAGSETTSTTMSWLCLYMALHPEVQAQVHQEIEAVVGPDRRPTLQDRVSMPFTEACILETLRLSSIVSISLFHRALENVSLQGTFIPKNTTLISNLYAVHHDPLIWGNDVEDFVPQRFLSQDGSKIVRHEQMLAFSCGKRVCIGESLARNELFLFTATVLQSFVLSPDPSSRKPTMAQQCGGVVCGPSPHQLVFSSR